MTTRKNDGRPPAGEWSPAERIVFQLMPAIGDIPVSYGELRSRRLAQLGTGGTEDEHHRRYKRVDKEICDGLRRLQERGEVKKDSEGGYSILFIPVERLLTELRVAEATLKEAMAKARAPVRSAEEALRVASAATNREAAAAEEKLCEVAISERPAATTEELERIIRATLGEAP